MCGRRHNTLLHRNDAPPSSTYHVQPKASAQHPAQPPPQPYYCPMPLPQHLQYPYAPPMAPQSQPAPKLLSITDTECNTANSSTAMILGTCVTVIESRERQHKARALVDNGSCLTFVTSKLVSTLKSHKISEPTAVMGFQQTATPFSQYKVDLHLRIPSGTVTILIPVRAVVVDVISGDLPSSTLSTVKQDACLNELPLADPNFDQPGRIDLLLGVDVLPRIMLEGRKNSADYTLSSTRSVYEWIVTGTCKSHMQVPRSHLCLKTSPLDQQTQDLLTCFWQVEDVTSNSAIRTEEEQAALQHFDQTHSRQSDGRYMYVVKLPKSRGSTRTGNRWNVRGNGRNLLKP